MGAPQNQSRISRRKPGQCQPKGTRKPSCGYQGADRRSPGHIDGTSSLANQQPVVGPASVSGLHVFVRINKLI
jgi:hypothetical protein